MKRWRVAALGGCTVGAILLACGPGFLDGISGGTSDGADARGDAPDTSDARACDPNVLPAPPPATDNQQAVMVPTFAFDTLRVDTLGSGDAGGALPVGLDLDNQCTCPEPDSCIRGGATDAGAACDGRRGEDNAMAAFFNSINQSVPGFEQTFATNRIQRGYSTFLVELLGWNGEPNDNQVTVTLRAARELQAAPIDGDAGNGFGPPKFDGTDIWQVDSRTVSGGIESLGVDCRDPKNSFSCLARPRDDNAYVRDGLIVAHPRFDRVATSSVPLTLSAGLGQLDFDVFELALFARMERGGDGSITRLTGELAGRVAVTNVLSTIAALKDFTQPESTDRICDNVPFFAVVRSQVCATPDLAPIGQDNRGARCDHLSMGMSFSALPAQVGKIARRAPVTTCDASVSCP